MKYIALLRGINVGGNNTVPMVQLKTFFEQAGFVDVATYINSGNVLFTSEIADASLCKAICENLLATHFYFKIPVMVISAFDLCEAMRNAPAWWNADDRSKHNAIFVIPPMVAADVVAQMGDTKPDYEQVGYFGNVIFWSAPVDTFSRTRYAKITSTAMYPYITIRNANTALKLAVMCS